MLRNGLRQSSTQAAAEASLGAKVVAIDLFAGAGGMSLGVERAGANVVLAVEQDANTAATYKANHHSTTVLCEAIDERWSLSKRMRDMRVPECHLLVGGPPCKGWSTLGARSNDKRRQQYNACVDYFIDQVLEVKPPAVLMENVRGLAMNKGGATLERLLERLRSDYEVQHRLLRAADFGVPQLRHRVFAIATRRDTAMAYAFPKRTHRPSTWKSVWSALGDLPPLTRGSEASAYIRRPFTNLQRALRGDASELTLHRAPNHSDHIDSVLSALTTPGSGRSKVEIEVTLTSGFHNTYGRLPARAPASAVTSSIGRISSGNHAHPYENRALSPREAARLQTFPDRYAWSGNGRWKIYEQIGNSVPPVLAEAVASPLVAMIARWLVASAVARGKG